MNTPTDHYSIEWCQRVGFLFSEPEGYRSNHYKELGTESLLTQRNAIFANPEVEGIPIEEFDIAFDNIFHLDDILERPLSSFFQEWETSRQGVQK